MNNQALTDTMIGEILKSVNYMIKSALEKTTKIYNGVVISNNNDGRWNIQYNGETHPVRGYGASIPNVGSIVKVLVPQGNQALSWFFVPIDDGGGSGDGVTFIPAVSEDGIISWTNNGSLPNPAPVNIKGPQGDAGPTGDTGPQGSAGPYFTPSVDSSGDLSWTNNGGLVNPSTMNIKGPQGAQGIQGIQGPQGETGAQGPQGLQGDPGYYFTPSVSDTGDLSWTNNGNLENPETINIKGPRGEQGAQGVQGEQGPQGIQGETGYYFTPSLNNNGDLSWSNNGGLDNPATVNIKGPQGVQGEQGLVGPQGPQGEQGPPGEQGPQGIQGETGPQGPKGDTGDAGPYFIPSVSSSGDLSWTNTGGLQNPSTVNIQGPQGPTGEMGPEGPQGEQGIQGPQGNIGPYFTPSVDSNGDLSWTNNGGLVNPTTVNIKGPQGDIGPQGPQGNVGPQGETGPQGQQGVPGANGSDATINGVNALTLTTTGGLTGTQSGNTYTIDGSAYALNTGDTLSGTYLYQGNAADGPVRTRGIWGLLGSAPNDLYLQYKNPGRSGKVRIGDNGQMIIDESGNLSTSGSVTVKKVNLLSAIQSIPLQNQASLALSTSGWTASGGQYYQQFTVSGITSDSVPVLIPQWSGTTANQTNQQTAWNSLLNIQSFNGYIRIFSSSPTTTSVDFIIYY